MKEIRLIIITIIEDNYAIEREMLLNLSDC